jgi:hypothetical protein
MTLAYLGAAFFGLVIGWVTYRTLRRRKDDAALSDIAAVIGAVGGGAVTALFKDSNMFGSYCIGLAVGFFGYLLVAGILFGKKSVEPYMGE